MAQRRIRLEADQAAAPDAAGRRNLAEHLQGLLGSLSQREKQVAVALLQNYPLAGLDTVSRLAERAGVSTATVLRLVNRLGFPVYADFQATIHEELQTRLQSPLQRHGHSRPVERTDHFLYDYAAAMRDNIAECLASVPASEFEAVLELLADRRLDIYLLGGRYSAPIAELMAGYLQAMRPQVRFIGGQNSIWPQYLLDMDHRSVLCVFDIRRYQHDVEQFARRAAGQQVRLVLFTDPWQSSIAPLARHVLPFPIASPSLLDSLTCALVLVEALLGALAHRLDPTLKQRFEQLETARQALQTEPNRSHRRGQRR